MNAEKIDIPDELKSLNPELQGKPILIGTNAFMIYPLTEGQVERVSKLISDVMDDIFTRDVECPNCKHLFKNVLDEQKTCNKCKGGHVLKSLQKSPIEALTYKDRAMKFLEELLGIPVAEIKNQVTIPQFKHLVGILYEQNFKDEGVVPEESLKNFKALLGWIGLGADKKVIQSKSISASEKSTKPLPTNMDILENTSRENGKQTETEEND